MSLNIERQEFENWLYLGQTFGMVGNTIPRIMQKIKGKHMSATHEVGDSEFEKWWTQFKSDEFRLAESGWTEKEIAKLAWRAAIKADEQDRKMPTDTQMLDWLIRKNTRVEHYPFRSIDEEVLVIDPYGNVLTSASNPREAIAKAMRGEK